MLQPDPSGKIKTKLNFQIISSTKNSFFQTELFISKGHV